MGARDLRFSVAVAEELHSSRAAARSRIVPAAVSQRIRDLEAELGVALFERTSRRVVLTPAGQRLLEPSRTVPANLASVSERARALASGASGRVPLALAPDLGSFGARFVAEVVPALPGPEVVEESMWGDTGHFVRLEAPEAVAAAIHRAAARQACWTGVRQHRVGPRSAAQDQVAATCAAAPTPCRRPASAAARRRVGS